MRIFSYSEGLFDRQAWEGDMQVLFLASRRQFYLISVAVRCLNALTKSAPKSYGRALFDRSVVSKESSLHVFSKIGVASTCAVVHVHCIGSGLKMLFWAQHGEGDWISEQAKAWAGQGCMVWIGPSLSLEISHTSFQVLFPYLTGHAAQRYTMRQ